MGLCYNKSYTNISVEINVIMKVTVDLYIISYSFNNLNWSYDTKIIVCNFIIRIMKIPLAENSRSNRHAFFM